MYARTRQQYEFGPAGAAVERKNVARGPGEIRNDVGIIEPERQQIAITVHAVVGVGTELEHDPAESRMITRPQKRSRDRLSKARC